MKKEDNYEVVKWNEWDYRLKDLRNKQTLVRSCFKEYLEIVKRELEKRDKYYDEEKKKNKGEEEKEEKKKKRKI